ncbi:MAG: tRNA uridine-5-carboxymethylaminomethyl(34) synthesis enzyme MnmG [Synergistales bacterium]|nr:tRNA uridine-5-carboxymethylaminomethyl(34) synthesis enzyme MnmG [Synergistales bacterium]MDY6401667.1 tRNA uridine-5-carboxymethylaminomethyl(34) synthesis enzyme MnmG [Synergistales bacterium]MDY6404253.1 tRNA uridine-5-carboxymethylaminomethyl(34) synthesis enzyme MnmG [Synergistales bacterium]MDY6411251.1 tRNA uridine-5-carboxymethylaminomethyl(34) synthesis enzyme MnmG [Synergistales bacterium]MDY6415019.1 tRNA uridine-5-carboxymethylaminomethyl(34) synthesis enzyme MnmG [Synergistales
MIGGGHAGCEAALASSRAGCKTLMLNLSVDNTALMPCNPSIGGPAKGHLVREVSALGGEQARAADASTLMIRWLNTSKGAAVRALRAQCDPGLYGTYYRKLLTTQENLEINQDEAIEILTSSGKISGVLTRHGAKYDAKAIVLCGGVYLNGRVFVGDKSFKSGPMGQNNSESLPKSLENLGIKTGLMRTDTTPRLNINTIDLSRAVPQLSEKEPLCFDLWGKGKIYAPSKYACYFSRTTEETYEILSQNIKRSPLVTGDVKAHGPRYCPSIEDKFLRFPDHITHPIVFEPVSLNTNEVYVQNFSTSLPYDVQVKMIHSLPGCEHAKIIKPGYGIEYIYLLPDQLKHTLENKNIPGFFCAGQVNGTSGYEEAAAQGLLAGINAAMYVLEKEPLILGRDEGYLGVLVDDLTTKSTDEPYRMLTSRCEHRLLLRWDNAAHRLSKYGRRAGLIDDAKWEFLERRFNNEAQEISRLKSQKISPSEKIKELCEEYQSEILADTMTLAEFLKHRGVNYGLISKISPSEKILTSEEISHIETELRYTGYLEREARVAEKMKNLDGAKIPEDFNYDDVVGLRAESLQKLKHFRPDSLGHALRISGVTPTDVQLISVILSRSERTKNKEK